MILLHLKNHYLILHQINYYSKTELIYFKDSKYMKFIISSSKLLDTINPLIGVVGSNPALPIIENILLEINNNQLTVKATDLETTIINKTDVESDINGSIAINAKLFLETLKSFSEQPLTFKAEKDSNSLEIVSEQGSYSIAFINGDEFPNTPELDESKSTLVSSQTLKNGITNTLFATTNDELRPVISGVYTEITNESILFVATDAHKLVKYKNKIQSNENTSFIIPKKPLQLIKNSLKESKDNIELKYNKTNAIIKQDKIQIYCRLVDGNYPNFEAVIPKDSTNLLVLEREIILNSLKRVSIFSNQTTRQVRFKIQGNELNISGEDLDFSNKANEILKCDYDGQDMEIGFNGKFLIEILNTLNSNKINMYLSGPSKAAIIKPDKTENGEELLMLVMPVMLSN